MKKVFMSVLAVLYVVVMTGFFYMLLNDGHHVLPEKPVLYLYPQDEQRLTVSLDLEGTLDTALPDPGLGARNRAGDPGFVDCDGRTRRNADGPGGAHLSLAVLGWRDGPTGSRHWVYRCA